MMFFSASSAHKKQSGFTMIEMLVYLAIFLVISTSSVGFMISLDDFIVEYRMETNLYRSGTGAMEQILLALRQADNVDLLNTVEDSPTNGRLSVENTASTTEFLFTGGELQFIIDSNNLGDLTGSDVTVDSFTVYQYASGDNEFVRVRLELTGTVGAATKTVTYYGGSVVRGAI